MGASECSFNVAHGENEIDASRVKDGDRVICTGTWDKNGVLQATVISKLCTGICQRTRSISEAGDDLDYLSKKDESSHGAGIEGTIEQLTRDSRYETRVIGFMAGISGSRPVRSLDYSFTEGWTVSIMGASARPLSDHCCLAQEFSSLN